MEKDSTSSAMPRLRFPAFRNAQDWDEKKAGSVFANRIEEGEEGLPIYSVTMHDGMVKRDFFDRDFYDIEDAGGNKKAHRNDITYNMMRMWQGASGVAMEDCMVSPAYVVLAPKEGVRSDFYAYLFKLPQYLRVLTAHSQGLTKDRLRLYYKDFAQIPLPLPSPTEQQKIADCLTSLDEAIAALGRKLAALADHKRGLMQQLFPREGETLPRLRFPEFRDAPEWVISRFDELYTFPPTNTFSRDQLSDSEGTIRNIHYGDIHTKFAASFRIRREQVPSVAPLISLVKNKSKAFCREGDMIFADASEDLNDVGKCIEIVELNGKLLLSGSHTILARRIGNKLAVGFGAYLFKSRNVRAQIENEAQGTKVMAISPNRLARIGVRYPVQLSEQQRIADCLSFLDARLAAEGEKLTALKTHKKGLMQQLFPAIDATKDVSAVEESRLHQVNEVTPKAVSGPAVDQPATIPPHKPYPTGFARQLLAAEILQHCHQHPTMGRVKLQKLIHLCEYCAELDDIHGNYARAAAGPFDNKLMRGVASGLEKQKWFKQVRGEKGSSYEPMECAGQHAKYLQRWSGQLPKIREIIQRFAEARTRSCEIASTLYAAWNDLLIDGKKPTDAEIIHEASDPKRWHESKANIDEIKWPTALKWMREKGLVPRGYGAHTTKRDE